MKNLLFALHICRPALLIFVFHSIAVHSHGQSPQHILDSLTNALNHHPQKDTGRIDILAWLAVTNSSIHPIEGINNIKEALDIAGKIKSNRDYGLWVMLGWAYMRIDDYPRSIEAFQSIFNVVMPESEEYASALHFIGMNYKAQGDYDKALSYTMAGHAIEEKIKANGGKIKDIRTDVGTPWNLGEIYFNKKVLDTALYYGRKAYEIVNTMPLDIFNLFHPLITNLLGKIYTQQGQRDSALKYLNETKHIYGYTGEGNTTLEIENLLNRAKWFLKFSSADSALWYATTCYERAKKTSSFDLMYQSAEVMRSVEEKMKKYDLALKYNDLAIAVKDSMLGVDKIKKTQAMHYEMQLKEQQVADLKNQLALKSRIRLITAGGLFTLLFVGLLYRTVQQRKKTINTLNEQNTLIESQKTQLHLAIHELREKQSQLIHAEKMASLGELTAGIAHEIQNPLNFVNNFSEINKELLFELKHEFGKEMSKRNDAATNELISDMESNTSKIYLHGKRAEAIARSMLEHSQSRPGEKTDTDINALAEEYLKLSYHAIRAKDKLFNANLITELDPSIHTLHIIPADIGRVFINIFNNAFYSMSEKEKKLKLNGDTGYRPTLTIRTKATSNTISIRIHDNGQGIPEKIRSKIFQPFFTTKPTGNGTGLGLSLSYDIITKAHHGNIQVDSVEGEYCEFNIALPV